MFTLIQLVLLAGLYVIKSTSIGISFPFFIGLLPVARYYIGKCGIVKEEYCEVRRLVLLARPVRRVILSQTSPPGQHAL